MTNLKICPECLGKITDNKCEDCGWNPEIAVTLKNLTNFLENKK